MDQEVWQKPVFLERYGQPGVITIHDTYEAARLLFRHYRLRKTLVLETALLTCRNAMIGETAPAMARYEFIEAAVSAGYHILPETFLSGGFRHVSEPVAFDIQTPRAPANINDTHNLGKTSSPKELWTELFRIGSELVHLLADRTATSVLSAVRTTERRIHLGH